MPDSLSPYSLEELERLLVEIKQTIVLREQEDSPATAAVDAAAVAPDGLPPAAPATVVEDEDAPATAAGGEVADEALAEAAPVLRYVHPASRNLSWDGEGSVPDWVTAYLAHGGSWSAMEYAAEQYLEGLAKRRALVWPPARKPRQR